MDKASFSDWIEPEEINILWSEFQPVCRFFFDSASLMNEGDTSSSEDLGLKDLPC